MRSFIAMLLAIAATAASSAQAQVQAPSRGELLYSTHCAACHTAQMHWRDQRVVRDWPGLKVEVRRWQAAASLAWGNDDIVEVARYLNERIYRFDVTPDAASRRSAALQRGPAAAIAVAPPLNRRPA